MNICVRGISKNFGEKKVLKDFSATFENNKITCLMGPSGCGKTTLLRILMGFTSADQGTLQGMESYGLGGVFQEDRLIENLSPVSNIRFVCPTISRHEILEAMASMGLKGCEAQPVRELSGGMRRRVALLRALLSDADLLFLDEPFKGLDVNTKAEVIARTKDFLIGRTVVLVTHEIGEAEQISADKIINMHPLNS